MRILFYTLRNLHLPHLLPVYEWMIENGETCDELLFSGADYIPASATESGYGLDPAIIQSLYTKGVRWIPERDITRFKPDVVVVADPDFRNGLDRVGARIVNVNHGLISKGCFYSDSPLSKRENSVDLTCVPGSYHREMLKRNVFRPILVTGLVKFDRIFNGDLERDEVLRGFGIDPSKRIVLFAPTFNPELSGVPLVTDSVRNWISEDVHLIIKLHGMSPPEWVELYRLLSAADSRITLIEELDLTESLVAADLMVSDVSSAFMEFISLDKPVILVNNPLRTNFVGFDPRDIEYRWRDVGLEIDDPADIPAAIDRCLANPGENSEKRQFYGQRLIGPADGRACERIGRAVRLLERDVSGRQNLIIPAQACVRK